jgi:hypothetical protein
MRAGRRLIGHVTGANQACHGTSGLPGGWVYTTATPWLRPRSPPALRQCRSCTRRPRPQGLRRDYPDRHSWSWSTLALEIEAASPQAQATSLGGHDEKVRVPAASAAPSAALARRTRLPASAATLPPFSLTTSAHVDVTEAPGQRAVAEWFVEDSGADALKVTMADTSFTARGQRSTRQSAGSARSGPCTSSWPPAYRDVRIVIRVPRGTAPGSYFVNVESSALVPGSSGIAGGVAATLEVDVSGG